MKRIIAASLLTAAAILGGFGCADKTSSGEVEDQAAHVAPAPEKSAEVGQDAGETAAGETADDGVPARAEGEPETLEGEILPESDDRELETTDLDTLNNWQLTLARNEIFARHGRPFENPDIREHFEALPWYSPNPEYEDAWLSFLERKNAEIILDHQKLSYEIPATHP